MGASTFRSMSSFWTATAALFDSVNPDSAKVRSDRSDNDSRQNAVTDKITMKTFIIKTLLAAAGTALLAQVAAAQTTTVNDGDLLLDFRAGGGTGFGTDYEVDLGAASLYFGAAPGSAPFTVSGVSLADLSVTYGSDWNARGDLYWGVIGSSGGSGALGKPTYTIWASAPEPTPGIQSAPWTRGSLNAQQITGSYVASLYDGFRNSPVAGSPTATLKLTGSPNSYETASQDVNGAVGTFGAFYPSIEGTPGAVLDLYEMQYGTRAGGTINADGALVGSFYFDANNNNALTFAAVPEPGACGLFMAAGVAALLLRQRRRRQA
jgi:hypothetical protein